MNCTSVMEDQTGFRPCSPRNQALSPSLFDNAIFGFAVLDKDLRYTYINETLAEMNGLPVADHIGKHIREILPHLAETVIPVLLEALRAGTPLRRTDVSGETSAVPGQARHWVIDAIPIYDRNGQPAAVGVTVFESTQLKKAREAVEKSEERFRMIAQSTNDVLWDWDLETSEGWWTEGLQRGVGYSSTSMTRDQWLQLVHPDEREALSARLKSCLEGDSDTCQGEFRFQRADGSYGDFAGRILIVRNDRRRPIRILGAMTDITERKRSEEERARLAVEVAHRKKQLESIVENIPGVVWEAWGRPDEASQRIEYVSDYVEELLGYTVEEWLSTPNFWLTIVAPEDRERMAAASAEAFAQGQGNRWEFRWLRKDGSRVWVESQTTVIKDDKGQSVGMRGVNIDITERKELEAQLRQSQKLEAVGLLAGGIAHDFNNLLTVINGYSDLALASVHADDPLSPKLTEIKNAGARAAALTRKLLIFSRKQMVQPVVIDLNAAIQDLQKMLQRVIGENIEFRTVLNPAVQTIKADRSHLEQVIMNLVVNARDAMPKGGKLTIETGNVFLSSQNLSEHGECKEGRYVVMAITDNGIGMDAQTQSRIFEPFFTTKELGKGTGLGLSTVYGIVQQSRGTISVYSEPGRGTTFKVYFPSMTEHASLVPALTESTDHKDTGTILLVEDEEGVRAVTSAVLEGMGYQVLVASNAEEALSITEKQPPIDLLLTDVVLPKRDGLCLARVAKHDLPDLKVLYMSGYTDNALMHQGLLDGTMSFIQKPFDTVTLAAKVREVLKAQ